MSEPAITEDRRRAREAEYVAAWETWFAALPPQEQAKLRAAKMDRPIIERVAQSSGEFDDPADAIDAGAWDRETVAMMEHGDITESEYAEVESAFARALVWAIQAPDLVQAGQRLTAMVKIMRPGLIAGMVHERSRRDATAARAILPADEAEQCGQVFGPALEWLRRGTSFSNVGLRAVVFGYVMGAGLSCALTLREMGDPKRITRQGISKLALDASDTFAGIRSRVMRGDDHRTACRISKSQK